MLASRLLVDGKIWRLNGFVRRITQAELTQDFGLASERRVELTERLAGWLSAAQATGALRRVWIFGSFVSTKPGPGDLDILALFAEDFDASRIESSNRHWFDHELCREIHEIDLFILKENTPAEVREMILETFGRDRSGADCLIEVLL